MSTGHELLSPSRRHRSRRCPGSVREEAKWPDSTGAAAIDGTHSHTLLERCINDGLVDPFNYVGQTMQDHDGSFVVDTLRAGRVKLAVDYLKDLCEREDFVSISAESKVSPKYLTGRDDMGGTIDVTVVFRDWVEIIDYKDGMSEAFTAARDQLEQYAVGKVSELGIPRGKPLPWTKVKCTMIQPKLAIKNMKPIVSFDLDIRYVVDDLVGQLVAEGKACDDPNAPLIPGDVQCKYCKVKTCAKRFEKSMTQINVIPMLDISQQTADHDPANMTDEQIAQILEAEPLITQLIKEAKSEATKRLNSGTSGELSKRFKMVKGRGSRVWALPEEEIAERLRKMGIPKDMVYESSLVSPAKAEKLVWEKKGAKTQLSARQINTLNNEYITHMEGKPTLAPISDERPALTQSAESLFSPVNAEVPAVPAETTQPVFSFPNVDTPQGTPIVSDQVLSDLPSWMM